MPPLSSSDAVPRAAGPSLAERLTEQFARLSAFASARMRPVMKWRPRPMRMADRILPVVEAMIAFVALTSLLTIAGAIILAQQEQGRVATLEPQAVPIREAELRTASDAEALLASVQRIKRPTVSLTIERLARALPADARLGSVAVDGDGMIEIAIDTPDPDLLREALKRDPALANLHERDQAAGSDGRMRVTLRSGG